MRLSDKFVGVLNLLVIGAVNIDEFVQVAVRRLQHNGAAVFHEGGKIEG